MSARSANSRRTGRTAHKGQAVSLDDVARLAGVSAGTVSRTLSRPEMISEATRERVHKAVQELGYVVNGAARALVLRQSRTIGAIVSRSGMASYSAMVTGLEETLAGQGYTLLLSAPDQDAAREPDILNTLIARGVDAMALLGGRQPGHVIDTLARHNIPYVLMWDHRSSQGHAIGFNEFEASRLVVSHLHELGHRTVAYIGGHTRQRPRSAKRKRGVLDSLKKFNMRLPDAALEETEHGFAEGFAAMQALLSEPGRLAGVTAVICGADYLAAGAMSALVQAGVSVPGQLSVVGFNDNDFAAYLNPALTTVSLPIRQIGMVSGCYLIDRLNGVVPEPAAALPVQLQVRGSTGAPWRPEEGVNTM